jgi:hypothetical protein
MVLVEEVVVQQNLQQTAMVVSKVSSDQRPQNQNQLMEQLPSLAARLL